MKLRRLSSQSATEEEYQGFKILHRGFSWYVYAMDGEMLSIPLTSRAEAMRFIDTHIRRGGK